MTMVVKKSGKKTFIKTSELSVVLAKANNSGDAQALCLKWADRLKPPLPSWSAL